MVALIILSSIFSVAVLFSEADASEAKFISSESLPPALIGTAKFKDGTPAYLETHTFEFKDGRLLGLSTEYRAGSSGAELIAKMAHAFPTPGYLPDYSYTDLRNGIEHRLVADTASGNLKMSRKRDGEESTKTIPLNGQQVAGQGVYFWILANLDKILKNERVYVKFVVPGLLGDYSFHADLLKTENGRHTIKVELDNWFFRLFASKTQFDLDQKTRRLLEYRGPSNVADAKRKYRDVVITYSAGSQAQAL